MTMLVSQRKLHTKTINPVRDSKRFRLKVAHANQTREHNQTSAEEQARSRQLRLVLVFQ
jgi:hypothetical protein